jgi:3-deoxy-D-manno-octulosonic-acid transferase
VLTGPHVRNFAAVYQHFITAGAAKVVHSAGDLASALDGWLLDPAAARAAGQAGLQLLARHAGATGRTMDALERFLA